MSRVGQNHQVQQWQGANWAENTTVRLSEKDGDVLRESLKTWIMGRTYNKGDLSFEDGKFSAINYHVHFRFLNSDKQTEREIREVRQAVYDALQSKFSSAPALKALQEFLFGPTATHEPLTCDELYSLFRLIDTGALETATYEDLARFMKKAHDIKHGNMPANRLDDVLVFVGGRSFRIGDFIKGYGRHDSVRKTTVNVDSYNEIIAQEKDVLADFQDKVDQQFTQLTERADANVKEFSLRQEETLCPVRKLCAYFTGLDERGLPANRAGLMEEINAFVEHAEAVLDAPGLKNAPKSWGKWIQPIADVLDECYTLRRKLRNQMRESTQEAEGEMEIVLQAPPSSEAEKALRKLLNGPVRQLAQGSAQLYQEIERDVKVYEAEQNEMATKLLFSLDDRGQEKYFTYLTARAKQQNKIRSATKPYEKGLEFLDSLKAGGQDMPAWEKMKKLSARLLQIFQGRVDRLPAVRGNPALRSILLDRVERDIKVMAESVLEAQMQVSSSGGANLPQHIEDDSKTFQVLLDFFNEDTADMELRDTLNEISKVIKPNIPEGNARLKLFGKMMSIDAPAEGGAVNPGQARRGMSQAQFKEYIRQEYGDVPAGMVDGLYIKNTRSNPLEALAIANKNIGTVLGQLRDKGYSEKTIRDAFGMGRLIELSVLFSSKKLLELALTTIDQHGLDKADHVQEVDGDERLLNQMRTGLPEDIKGRIMEVMGLDENQLETYVNNLLSDSDAAIKDATAFRREFPAVLKELGLYDVVDKKLLGDILKYAMFAGNGMDKVIAGVVRSVSESGYADVIQKAACVTQGRIRELDTRISLCEQFITQIKNEQAKRHRPNPEDVKSATGRDVFVPINLDTEETGTIFASTYERLRNAEPNSDQHALRGKLLQRVSKYRAKLQALKDREKRWLDVLAGPDAGLGLQLIEKSVEVDPPPGQGERDVVLRITVLGQEAEDGPVSLSRNDVKARLQADLIDLVGKSGDDDGNVDGAQITCVLGREQAKLRNPEPAQVA